MNFDNTSRNQLCPCGSNMKFKFCHGKLNKFSEIADEDIEINASKILSKNGYYIKSLMSQEFKSICQNLPKGKSNTLKNVPPGMIILENFIDDELCNNLVKHTENIKFTKATLVDTKQKPKSIDTTVDESTRKTEIFDLGIYDGLLKQNIVNIFNQQLNKHYNVTFSNYEQPHILRYTQGGFYNLHADSEYWDVNAKKWKRVKQRDFSFLLYLNDDFTGGELDFPNFNFTLKPKKGMFVCFPSDHRFMHKAMLTTSGKRYAIVTWAAIADTEGLNGLLANPDMVILVE